MLKLFIAVTILMGGFEPMCADLRGIGSTASDTNNNNDGTTTTKFVTGFIYDSGSHELIDSVLVCLSSSNCDYTGRNATRDNENYVLWVNSGNYTLTASHPEYETYTTPITVYSKNIKHDITMYHK